MFGALKAAIGTFAKYGKSSGEEVQLSGFRSLKTMQVEPELLELCRAGRLHTFTTTAVAGARAPVVDVPTTTANWILFNPASNTKCLVPVYLGAYLGSGTADTGAVLIAGVTPSKLTDANAVASNAANHGTASMRSLASTRAFVGVGVTVPTMASSFTAIGGIQNSASTTPGTGNAWRVYGMFVVQPGHGLAIDVISGAGTASKFSVTGVYAELELDID